jgi:hypothetical protein
MKKMKQILLITWNIIKLVVISVIPSSFVCGIISGISDTISFTDCTNTPLFWLVSLISGILVFVILEERDNSWF